MLTNLAAARYFAGSGRFKLVRHGVLPLGGAALMVALLVGQIIEQTVTPYTWFPWVIVGWVALVGAGALWLAAARPRAARARRRAARHRRRRRAAPEPAVAR